MLEYVLSLTRFTELQKVWSYLTHFQQKYKGIFCYFIDLEELDNQLNFLKTKGFRHFSGIVTQYLCQQFIEQAVQGESQIHKILIAINNATLRRDRFVFKNEESLGQIFHKIKIDQRIPMVKFSQVSDDDLVQLFIQINKAQYVKMINTEVNLKSVLGDFLKKIGFSSQSWNLFTLNETLVQILFYLLIDSHHCVINTLNES